MYTKSLSDQASDYLRKTYPHTEQHKDFARVLAELSIEGFKITAIDHDERVLTFEDRSKLSVSRDGDLTVYLRPGF